MCDSDDVAVACILAYKAIFNKKKQKRKIWMQKWLARRNEHDGRGVLAMLDNELRVESKPAYKNFLRMNEECFNVLLDKIKHKITYQDTHFRESISASYRLALTLRYLASGNSFKDLSFATRIGRSTISQIIPEVLAAIYLSLKDEYLKPPTTPTEWLSIANDFKNIWNFPNCLGSMDGKHIVFRPPRSEGSYFFNYKLAHSIVLLAVVDAKYRFRLIDVGTNGRSNDGGVYQDSLLSKAISENKLNFPADQPLPNGNTMLPFVFIGDDAFPLSQRIMKPYKKHIPLTESEKNFNYRLSRARGIVEMTFGIFANRFRIFLAPISLSVQKVDMIVLACCALHNFLCERIPNQYMMLDNQDCESLRGITSSQAGNRPSNKAIYMRKEFEEYFYNRGSLEWQYDAVTVNGRY